MYPRPPVKEPVSVIMPVYNEGDMIETVVSNYAEVVIRHLPAGSEFVIQDGGSNDGTKEILQECEKRWPFLRVIYEGKKEGIPRALQALIRAAKCPWVFMVDSDGQSLATEFWQLAPHMEANDVILGLRTVRHDPLYRRYGSMAFSLYAGALFGLRVRDINAAFRLCRREVMMECADRYGHLSNAIYAESTIWCHALGYRICQVPVMFGPRLYGQSHAFPEGTQWTQFFRSFAEVTKLRGTINGLRKKGELKGRPARP